MDCAPVDELTLPVEESITETTALGGTGAESVPRRGALPFPGRSVLGAFDRDARGLGAALVTAGLNAEAALYLAGLTTPIRGLTGRRSGSAWARPRRRDRGRRNTCRDQDKTAPERRRTSRAWSRHRRNSEFLRARK